MSAIWLGLEAVAAAGLALMLARVTLPTLPRIRYPALIAQVWLPVALLLPTWFMAAWVRGPIEGPGWAPCGPAAVYAALGVGLALLAGGLRGQRTAGLTAGLAAAGVVLLLQGLAGDLDDGSGLLYFGLVIVLLWLGVPSLKDVRRTEPQDERAESRAGATTLAALGLAIVQCIAIGGAGPAHWRIALAIALVPAVVTLAAAARVGAVVVLRIGAWLALLGVPGGLTAFVIVQRFSILGDRLTGGGGAPDPVAIAWGFDRLAFEGLLLLFVAVVLAVADDLDRSLRRAAGTALLLLAAVVAGARVIL